MKQKEEKSLFSLIPLKGIVIPIIFGAIVTYYVAKKHSGIKLQEIFSLESMDIKYLCLSLMLIFAKDFFYALRLRELTDRKTTLLRYIMIMMLWDFSSALTPSVAGGGVVVVFLLTREGVKFGTALASIMLATVIDNLVFLYISPLGFFSIRNLTNNKIDEFINVSSRFGITTIFIIGLMLIIAYTSFMSFALWINPALTKKLLVKITSKVKFLKKWQGAAEQQGGNLILASKEIKEKKISFWIKVFLYTLIAIFLRYSILNSVIASVMSLSFIDGLVSMGNQVLLWVVMLLSPTPGSAGTAEFFFDSLYFDLLGSEALRVQIIWRFFTYYLNIIMGGIVLFWYVKWQKNKTNL